MTPTPRPCRGRRTEWAGAHCRRPRKEDLAASNRERTAQILLTSIQTNGSTRTNHARDTATSFQDDRRTRKCRNRALPNRLRTLWNPPKHPSESSGSVPEHPPGRPRTCRGAPRSRQAENMQTAAERAPTPASELEHLVQVDPPSPPPVDSLCSDAPP